MFVWWNVCVLRVFFLRLSNYFAKPQNEFDWSFKWFSKKFTNVIDEDVPFPGKPWPEQSVRSTLTLVLRNGSTTSSRDFSFPLSMKETSVKTNTAFSRFSISVFASLRLIFQKVTDLNFFLKLILNHALKIFIA